MISVDSDAYKNAPNHNLFVLKFITLSYHHFSCEFVIQFMHNDTAIFSFIVNSPKQIHVSSSSMLSIILSSQIYFICISVSLPDKQVCLLQGMISHIYLCTYTHTHIKLHHTFMENPHTSNSWEYSNGVNC